MKETPLDQKFESIINDPQLHLDFLDWYKSRTAEKAPPSFWQKAAPPIILPISLILIVSFFFYLIRDRVEQEVYDSHWRGTVYKTWVFVDGKIVHSWTDPVSISDSMKNVRRIEGERILNTLK